MSQCVITSKNRWLPYFNKTDLICGGALLMAAPKCALLVHRGILVIDSIFLKGRARQPPSQGPFITCNGLSSGIKNQ